MPEIKELVTCVNDNDEVVASMEKLSAHRDGTLHRAVSVFIFNSNGQLLIQRRALSKYHSAGLWSNTTCGHPWPGENYLTAAQRRLYFEMGLKTPLKPHTSFRYRVNLDNGLIENEIDKLFIGYSDIKPKPNNEEVVEWKYISRQQLEYEILQHPEQYTEWFKMIVKTQLLDSVYYLPQHS